MVWLYLDTKEMNEEYFGTYSVGSSIHIRDADLGLSLMHWWQIAVRLSSLSVRNPIHNMQRHLLLLLMECQHRIFTPALGGQTTEYHMKQQAA